MRLGSYIKEEKNDTLTTKLQEGLACVGFAIRQLKGKLTIQLLNDAELFTQAHQKYCETDSTTSELWEFAQKRPDYVKSVVASVDAVVKSGYLKGNYTFSRGRGFMNTLYKQFQPFKKEGGFSGDDKWNPSDIWASKIPSVSGNFRSLVEYNSYISDNLKSGVFVGISLKKIGKGGAKVSHIEPASEHEPVVYKGIVPPKKNGPFGTGVNISTNKNNINFRSFNKGASITGELMGAKGGGARHGKVQSSVFKKSIKDYCIPQITPQSIKNMMVYDGIENVLRSHVLKLWKDLGYTWTESQVNTYWDHKIGRSTDVYTKTPEHTWTFWLSLIQSLELSIFMEKNKGVADDLVNSWFLSASSMSSLSSEYIKVY